MSDEPERFAQWMNPDHALAAGALWISFTDAVNRFGATFDVLASLDVDVNELGDYLNHWTISIDGLPRYRLTLDAIDLEAT